MKGKIVTIDNCKVGDKIMYTKEFLDNSPFYRKAVKEYNIVYLKIIEITKFSIRIKLTDYKGLEKLNFTHGIEINKFYFYE